MLVKIHKKHLVQRNSTEKISVISCRFIMHNTKAQLHFRFAATLRNFTVSVGRLLL